MTAIQSTHQKPLFVQLASGTDQLPHKEWKDMNYAEKILKILSFGLYSPRFTSVELSTAASLIQEFKPVAGVDVDTWQAVFNDGSAVILSEQKDGKLRALVWNTAETKPEFFTHTFTDIESNNITRSLERNALNKVNYSEMISDSGNKFTVDNVSGETFPVYLSISLAKTKVKISDRNFNHSPAGKFYAAFDAAIISETENKLTQMIHAPTTPCTLVNNGQEHTIKSLWNDIPRSVTQPLILEGKMLPYEAQKILLEAIINNPEHIPDDDQRQEIINICGGKDSVGEPFTQSLRSQIAMTAVGAIMSQTLIIDSRNMNKALMESQFYLHHYMSVANHRYRLAEVSACGNSGATSYAARFTFTEPLVKVAADHSAIEGGISVSRVDFTVDENTRLPEKDAKSDYMDIPVTYSNDVYWPSAV